MRLHSDPLLSIALTANICEWYEFSVTSFMALEIGQRFFPVVSEQTALALGFSVFAASYLARPFGSLFFGILGNRRGTGTALRFSMIGMAIPASLIAFLPTYDTTGYLATALLISLKMLQGFAAGAEMPLCGYFVSLNAPQENRGLYCAFVTASGFVGMLLASGVVYALPYCVAMLPATSIDFVASAWRWPFLFGIPLSLTIYRLRSSLSALANSAPKRASHSLTVWPLLHAAVIVAFMEADIYTILIWLPNYLHSYLGVSKFASHATNVGSLTIFCLSMVGAGRVSRSIAASKIVLYAIGTLTCGSYPLFLLLLRGDLLSLLLAQAALAALAGCLVGVVFVVLADLFKNNWRNVGMASTYSVATALFGGTAPIVCTWLIKATHSAAAPAFYLTAMGLLATPCAYGVASKPTGERVGPPFASARR